MLEEAKSFMKDHALGIDDELMETLQQKHHPPPEDTLFRDDVFPKVVQMLKGRKEPRILQDISQLLVPSPEQLALLGAEHLENVESVDGAWFECIPLAGPRPQPDAAFGLSRAAFTEEQRLKMRPYTEGAGLCLHFKGTYFMYFPFFGKEVKCGASGLDVADNQNGHSMTLAVRAVVELYKLVGREEELHRKVVAFAASHDDRVVRIYAYCPFFEGDGYSIWRHTVNELVIGQRTKWITRDFVLNCLETFVPLHIARVRSALDDLEVDPGRKELESLSEQQASPESLLATGHKKPRRKK